MNKQVMFSPMTIAVAWTKGKYLLGTPGYL